MGYPAPSKLYFSAAALFLCVVAMGLIDSGFELRSLIGLAMAATMIALGVKLRSAGISR